jgi:hypothetical protein
MQKSRIEKFRIIEEILDEIKKKDSYFKRDKHEIFNRLNNIKYHYRQLKRQKEEQFRVKWTYFDEVEKIMLKSDELKQQKQA